MVVFFPAASAEVLDLLGESARIDSRRDLSRSALHGGPA